MDRKAFGGPYSQGYHHDFNLGSSISPCERIVSISVDITIQSYTPNIPPGCSHSNTFYNTYYGCAPYNGMGGSCPTSNVIGELPFPPAGAPYSQTYDNDCNPNTFDFGGNFSVDIVPVFTTGCTNGQDAVNQGYVALTYTIIVTVQTDLISCTGTGCLEGTTTVQPCNDGDPCTENDMQTILDCDGSICVPCMGTPIDCSTGTTTTLPCDDGDQCTTGETQTILDCDGSICVPCGGGMPIDCSTGTTTTLPCDDGDPCTTGETQTILDCDGTVCVPCGGGVPIDCSTGPTTTLPCDDGD
ncbi:MAG: hypothetical protein MRY85_10375, partial [Phaeodactylibacter sp.]